MIGDVSSHGYRAALIMALAMSASAIHAQTSVDPAETLAAVLRSLGDELTSTEMFISAFYAVLDPDHRELRFANAGHPHAFVIHGDGSCERLGATAPPLGMVDEAPRALVRPWDPERDTLLLFTDGVSDARDRFGRRLGEEAVLETARVAHAADPANVLERIFDRLRAHTGDAAPRDDLTVVVARN
jgi:sigma-B regulation protein RsbU (phosphoserine phosphatase)